ncbi:hypothetical protein MRB53_040221 [Persea americana]|nr:hypothetical protein MRB53_040221 [Persea americana]
MQSSKSAFGHDLDSDDSDDGRIPLVRTADDLVKARNVVRVRYARPQVLFVLPKVRRGREAHIDNILKRIEATGATIMTADMLPPTTSLAEAMPLMLGDHCAGLTPTLNIDCTILLALVSDLSHDHVERAEWFHKATLHQIDSEERECLLPSILYPAVAGRALVCTEEAATRMHEIVATIGTETERMRTALLFGEGQHPGTLRTNGESESESSLLARWKASSSYDTPSSLRLPVRIVLAEDVSAPTRLPVCAAQVRSVLTAINQSVFMYGWRVGLTTVTSNRTVLKAIENAIDEALNKAGDDGHDFDGPKIWLVGTARSLIGKEKTRKQ